jgi:hypothetical protein
MEAKLFAHAPELFDGKEVSFTFTPEACKTASM